MPSSHPLGPNFDIWLIECRRTMCEVQGAVHTIVYAAAVPWLRTLAFAVSWLAMLCIFPQILL